MALLDTGFRILCIVSIVAAFVAMGGTGWTFVTRLEGLPDTPEPNGGPLPPVNGEPGNIMEPSFLTHLKRPLKWPYAKPSREYLQARSAFIQMWERAKPVILSCCAVGFMCGLVQCVVSVVGLCTCVDAHTRTRCWLIVHFLLFLFLTLSILTAYISNMNQDKEQSWRYKSGMLENSARKSAVPPEYKDDASELTHFVYMSTVVIYGVLCTDIGIILVLFFGVIWLLKVEHLGPYKYGPVPY